MTQQKAVVEKELKTAQLRVLDVDQRAQAIDMDRRSVEDEKHRLAAMVQELSRQIRDKVIISTDKN